MTTRATPGLEATPFATRRPASVDGLPFTVTEIPRPIDLVCPDPFIEGLPRWSPDDMDGTLSFPCEPPQRLLAHVTGFGCGLIARGRTGRAAIPTNESWTPSLAPSHEGR